MVTYDETKREINLSKHDNDIELAECEPVFDAPMLTREMVKQLAANRDWSVWAC
jgi:uncharacterized DUF497 family protein